MGNKQPFEKVEEYVSSGNSLGLRTYLQSLSANELRYLNLIKSDKSPLLIAVQQWIKIRTGQINGKISDDDTSQKELFDFASVIRILAAYGMKDLKVAQSIFSFKEKIRYGFKSSTDSLVLFDELQRNISSYTISDVVTDFGNDKINKKNNSQQEIELKDFVSDFDNDQTNEKYNAEEQLKFAVCKHFKTFNNEKELEKYYNLVVKQKVCSFSEDNISIINKKYTQVLSLLREVNSSKYVNKLEKLITQPKRIGRYSSSLDYPTFKFFNLKESSFRSFDRKTYSRRENLEKSIIDNSQKFCLDRIMPFNYLSLSFGKGLEDFITIGKLIKTGYKNLNIILIGSEVDSLRQFKDELNQFALKYGATVKISNYKSLEEYEATADKVEMQVITAIDYFDISKKEIFNDVISSHKLLAKNGYFYLSFDRHDFCFNQDKCISYKSHEPLSFIEKAKKAIEDMPQTTKNEIKYASLGLQFNLQEWMELIPLLVKKGYQKISVTMLNPKLLSFYDFVTAKNNMQLNKENLEYLFKLLAPRDVSVEVHMEESFDSFMENSKDKSEYQIVTLLGQKTYDSNADPVNIEWLKSKFDENILFYHVTNTIPENIANFDDVDEINQKKENDLETYESYPTKLTPKLAC